jgi:hypothetical protein
MIMSPNIPASNEPMLIPISNRHKKQMSVVFCGMMVAFAAIENTRVEFEYHLFGVAT